MWRIFDQWGSSANTKHGSIKCSASELLTLYSLLRHFAETRLPQQDPNLSGQLHCFYLACKAVDTIMIAKRGRIPMAEAGTNLRTCLHEWLTTHKELHGDAHVKPKTHWAFDIADQFVSDPWIVDSFVIERLHLRVRAIAENVKMLTGYAGSVLSGIVNHHSHHAQECLPGCGLLGRAAALPSIPGVLLSDRMEIQGLTFSVGDFVAHGSQLGCLVACCLEAGDLFGVVNLWTKVEQLSQHSSKWENTYR